MIPPFRIFKPVPNLVFAPGAISQLSASLQEQRRPDGYVVYIIDHYFADGRLNEIIAAAESDVVHYLDTTDEPTSAVVNALRENILAHQGKTPDVLVAIGGGSTLDTVKALSIIFTNKGKAEEYQGWDLVSQPGILKIGVPTISGTGAEVSRTAVLTGPLKKQGINSDFSLYDSILLDPSLLSTVPAAQRFYTGMDCYIHCVESLSGCFINEFARAFASKALDLCTSVFLKDGSDADLMVASLMGGYSIVYSEVGLVHALSYGISWAFHIHHGEANCIIFNALERYYPQYVEEFRQMVDRQGLMLALPKGLTYDDALFEKMADIVLLMQRPLHNALGADWRNLLPKEKIIEFYHQL
ncbi:MAG: iron-containing alcohol dehydrogenase, partial [Calditrichaeota bacterium]